jgi:hypothetical protein
MNTAGESLPLRFRHRIAWGLFAVGMVLQPLAWIVWMCRVRPEWWASDGKPLGISAEHIKQTMFSVGLILCAAAPSLSCLSFRRKLGLSLAAAVAAFVLGYLSSFLVLFIYGL